MQKTKPFTGKIVPASPQPSGKRSSASPLSPFLETGFSPVLTPPPSEEPGLITVLDLLHDHTKGKPVSLGDTFSAFSAVISTKGKKERVQPISGEDHSSLEGEDHSSLEGEDHSSLETAGAGFLDEGTEKSQEDDEDDQEVVHFNRKQSLAQIFNQRVLTPLKNRLITPTSKASCFADLAYAAVEIKNPSALKTLYLKTPEEQKLCSTVTRHGRLYFHDAQQPLDTKTYQSKNGPGFAAYALDRKARLYVAAHRSPASPLRSSDLSHPLFQQDSTDPDFFYHSSFLAAEAGKCFGMISVNEGKIIHIDNHSGHYKPDSEHLNDAVERLRHVSSDDIAIVHASDDSDQDDPGLGALFG